MKALPIVGWYGRRNSGDEAFRDVHKLVLPDVPLTWFRHGAVPPYDPNIDKRNDLVLVSAGDIISPFYFEHIPATAKIIVYGAGIGWDEEFNFLGKMKDRLDAVWVRNIQDVAPLQERGVKAFYTPDIVFNLAPLIQEKPPRTDRKKRLLYSRIANAPTLSVRMIFHAF